MQQVGLFTETFQQIQSRKGPKEAMNIISKSVFYISIGSNDFNHFLLQNASGVHSRYWPWEFNRLLVTSIRNELKVLFICFTSKVFPYLTRENCGKLEGKKKKKNMQKASKGFNSARVRPGSGTVLEAWSCIRVRWPRPDLEQCLWSENLNERDEGLWS